MKNKISIERIKEILTNHKKDINERYGVKEMGIFGSYVRGDEKRGSDLDVLVEFDDDARIGLLKFIEMENYLSDLLRIKTDLVEKSTLKPRIGKYILNEVIYL